MRYYWFSEDKTEDLTALVKVVIANVLAGKLSGDILLFIPQKSNLDGIIETVFGRDFIKSLKKGRARLGAVVKRRHYTTTS